MGSRLKVCQNQLSSSLLQVDHGEVHECQCTLTFDSNVVEVTAESNQLRESGLPPFLSEPVRRVLHCVLGALNS